MLKKMATWPWRPCWKKRPAESVSLDFEQSKPELPAAYDLVFFEQVESIRTAAVELADQGYDEGTLIWVLKQTRAKVRLNKKWICNHGDLHCAVILRPDFEQQKYYQMLIVAIVSLGNAIAAHVSAMTVLGYNCPTIFALPGIKLLPSGWTKVNQMTEIG